MWPQIATICLLVASFSMSLVLHGKPKNQNYSIWISLISIAIWAGLLSAGGFFNVLKG